MQLRSHADTRLGAEVYNLIIKYQPWGNVRDRLDMQRIFESTDGLLAQRFNPLNADDRRALTELPTLLVQERGGQGSPCGQVATIHRALSDGGFMNLEYAFDADIPPIPTNRLMAAQANFGVGDDFEWSRTHWAIKEVDLFRAVLKTAPAKRLQPKVFRLNEHDATDDALISVMMPFRAEFDPVFTAIRQASVQGGMRCVRADSVWDNDQIMQDVVGLIDRGRIVVVDCTLHTPNVFYELGIAHTLGKDVIMITQSADDVPFDLQHLRVIVYRNDEYSLKRLETALAERIAGLLA